MYPNGSTASWTYEPTRDLLTSVTNCVNGAVISAYDYTNDILGRRTAIGKSGTMMDENEVQPYTYNTRDELTSGQGFTYAYDDIGNRIEAEGRDYTANELNQYTAIDAFAPTYDLDGNQTKILTSTGEWQVEYNAENRPVRWTQGNIEIEMAYDRMGRRISYHETRNGANYINAKFVYNGYLCIQRLYGSSNGVYQSFVWDPTEPAATRPLSLQIPSWGATTFYMHDGNKNVSDLIYYALANGIAAHYDYAPFGAVTRTARNTRMTQHTFIAENPFRFSSEYHDNTLGLVYYNYRHYNPKDGRWCGRDPVEEVGGLNLYVFCANSSISQLDVWGLKKNEEEVCDKDHEYKTRAMTTMAFSLKDEDPDSLKNRLNAVITLVLTADAIGSFDAPSLALSDVNTLLGLYPSGAEVAVELLKNYGKIVKSFMSSQEVDVWSKVQCQECKCTNSFSSSLGLSTPKYAWETVDESEWIKCDIQKTSWGRKARRAGVVSCNGSIEYYLLSKQDREEIRKQCGKQAEKYCEE